LGKKGETVSCSWGSKLLLTWQKTTRDCGPTFILTISSRQLNW
jgi:hypothetical protein